MIEFGLGCEYQRERKKRGKASRKELAQQAATQATGSQNAPSLDGSSGDNNGAAERQSASPEGSKSALPRQSERHDSISEKPISELLDNGIRQNQSGEGIDNLADIAGRHHLSGQSGIERDHLDNGTSMELNGYGNVSQPQPYDRPGMSGHMMGNHQHYDPSQGAISHYPELPYSMQAQNPATYNGNSGFRIGHSPLGYGMGGGPTSPGWGVSIPSPSRHFQPRLSQPGFHSSTLKYPVLEPLVPHLGNVIPVSLACDLVELYFSSSSSAQLHPMSPYVLGVVFRKRSFLHPTRPRVCQPALLASMLWVAAQTSDASYLTSMPSSRSKTCQKLLEMTVSLLKPLIHNPSSDASPATSPAADGVALGGLGVALPGTIGMEALSGENGAFGAAGTLDDAVTYIHLATVVSASEYKGASLRWWNAAWSLARELKLGRELPPSDAPMATDRGEMESEGLDEHDLQRNTPGYLTEEEREERRRIWWLAYIVDRHLALCYNRPLFLLDIECEGLLQPMDDRAWQNGEFGNYYSGNTDSNVLNPIPENAAPDDNRVRGPHFECRGHSIFGYFLPLMTILGEIVDLHHARNHPRFGVAVRFAAREWDDLTAEITRHLEAFEQSLKRFEQQHIPKLPEDKLDQGHGDGDHHGNAADQGTPSVHSVHTNGSNRLTESDIQARIVIAYGTHVMHVLHILLAGKWDPINLLDDNDLWISTQGFITATSHAVSAAEAISQILEFDPGLEFMPFFFGIYLLQGSFLLLLIADKLQSEASASVVKACETIVRAHEACVVTLNTEYQVSTSFGSEDFQLGSV